VTGIGWRMERVCDLAGAMAMGVFGGARMLPRAGNWIRG
jgi:hypothetical protein